MNRPSIAAYILGSRFTCPLFLLLAAVLLYLLQTHPPDNDLQILTIIGGAILLIAASLKAFWQVYQYESWKKQWNNVAEDPKKKAQRNRNGLLIIGAVVWCALLYWFSFVPHASDQGELYTLGSYLFVFITLAALLWFFIRLFLRLRLRNKARQAVKEKNHIVSVFLPVPSSSPKQQQITASLPSYCQSLLKP